MHQGGIGLSNGLIGREYLASGSSTKVLSRLMQRSKSPGGSRVINLTKTDVSTPYRGAMSSLPLVPERSDVEGRVPVRNLISKRPQT